MGEDGQARCWTVARPPTPSPLGSCLGLRGLLSGCPPSPHHTHSGEPRKGPIYFKGRDPWAQRSGRLV